MNKKNDKRLCWNCDGSVPHHLGQCPYCGVDLTHVEKERSDNAHFSGFSSPYQAARVDSPAKQSIPTPPFSGAFSQDVTEEEWNAALGEEEEVTQKEEELTLSSRREMIALLLLLPGVVFFLFGLALLLFSSKGVLTLEWNQNFAYFYFLGAVPLLFLGWRALR